jgi:hypothetical protein
MLVGLALNELMVGLAAVVDGAGAAQAAEPISARAIKTRNHFCVFTFTSIF